MAKKSILGLALALLAAGGVCAQGKASAGGTVRNWISGEGNLLGFGARYERMLNDRFSIGANVYWNTFFFIWDEFELGFSARFYPRGNIFFIGLGLGFHQHTGVYRGGSMFNRFGAVTGGAITPEVGWKIDVGSAGKFFLSPGIKVPVTLGYLESYGGYKGRFRAGFGIVPYFGLGYAF